MVYAGFWWRLLAFIIDAVLLNVVFALLSMPFSPAETMIQDPATGNMIPSPDYNSYVMKSALLGTLISWIYMIVLESSAWQGTVGKKLLKLRVTDEAGNRISVGKATWRTLSKIISSLILGIGYLMVAFTGKKQGLHDIIARTLVVKA